MARMTDWHHRLQVYLDEVRGIPFEYGVLDCALFSAGAVDAMTGNDPAADFRGSYSTHKGGIRAMRNAGFKNHVAMAASLFPAVDLGRALPGDLAVVEEPGTIALGVIQGEMIYVLGKTGLGYVLRARATMAFSI